MTVMSHHARTAPRPGVRLTATGAVPNVEDADVVPLHLPSQLIGSVGRAGGRTPLALGDALAVAAVVPLAGAHALVGVCAVAATVALTAAVGGYRARLDLSTPEDLPMLLSSGLVGAAVLHLLGGVPLVVAAIAVCVALLGVRSLVVTALGLARGWGVGMRRVLVVGTGDLGRQVTRAAIDHPRHGVLPVGFVDDGPVDAASLPVPLVGGTADLEVLVRAHGVSELIIVPGEGELAAALRAGRRLDCEVLVVRSADASADRPAPRRRDVDELWGVPLVRVRREDPRGPMGRLRQLLPTG